MAFARRLVGECAHMVLVARRKDVLMELADELRAANSSLEVTVVDCDLASQRARERLIQLLQELPAGKTLLINNAGLGDYGEYISSSPKRNHQMLHVNILAVASLRDLPAVLIAEDAEPDAAVIAKAKEQEITLLRSPKSAYALCVELGKLLA